MDSLVDMKHLPALLRMTYTVLGTRALLFASVIMTFLLFCWCMRIGTTESIVTAVCFAACVLWPIIMRFSSNRQEDSHGEDT